jgi:Cu-processing system ATP-binding protein
MSLVAEWSHASKRYAKVSAVTDVTLGLDTAQATALVGHNGAGKTTLIKLLLGLVRPDSGMVRIGGEDPSGSRGTSVRRAIGFLPESVAFHGAMTGHELMAFYARLKRAPQARNAELLEQVGIAHAAHRRVATYSKGMRQRLGLAQALIGEPRLLLLDEPTSGLDPASRRELYDGIDGLRRNGATVLLCSHALDEVEARVDRVAVMHQGRLLAAGTLDELRRGLELDLSVRVHVRPCTTGRVAAALPPAVRVMDRSESRLTLSVPPRVKVETLRAIARAGDLVEDLDMTAPGLPELYARLVRQAEAHA